MKTAAIFDLDGTIVNKSAEVTFFLYLVRHGEVATADLLAWFGRFFKRLHVLGYPEAAQSNKLYLRNKRCGRVYELISNCFREQLVRRIWPGAIAEIERHRRQGRSLVLLSGTLTILLEHFLEYLHMDLMIGTPIGTEDGRFTGELSGPHPFGEAKALAVRQLAERHDLDLSNSFGYANTFADVPFLTEVGHPIAVNPSRRLARHARKQGWEIRCFRK